MKYELTDNTFTAPGGTILHQIQATKDFNDVTKGDLGGYIEKEENLSHKGLAWVYRDARVFGGARVFGDAQISTGGLWFGEHNDF